MLLTHFLSCGLVESKGRVQLPLLQLLCPICSVHVCEELGCERGVVLVLEVLSFLLPPSREASCVPSVTPGTLLPAFSSPIFSVWFCCRDLETDMEGRVLGMHPQEETQNGFPLPHCPLNLVFCTLSSSSSCGSVLVQGSHRPL